MGRLTCAFTAIAGLLLTASCAAPAQVRTAAATPRPSTPVAASLPPGGCDGFALSIVPDAPGHASPQAAAEWAVRQGEATGYPGSGWQPRGRDELGVNLASGGATLHVIQLPNQTWMVDSGQRC